MRSFLAALAFACALIAAPAAQTQTNHALHHDVYQNWVNQRDKGCCNDQDCGELSEENERPGRSGGIEVRVEGEWCKVEAWHYLKKGNAPNWSTSHVCVTPKISGFTTNNSPVCERLLCYQPKPGI